MFAMSNGKPIDKVVFVGSFGVGKTVALENLSDVPVIGTDVQSREALSGSNKDKTTTTVGFDYGEWHLGDVRKAHLYGLPSQTRFEAVWDIILPQSSAVVLLAFGNREDGLEQARFWLKKLKNVGVVNRMCVAVTRIEPDSPVLDDYRELVSEYHPLVPVITVDPRERDSVIQAITVALCTPYMEE